MFIFYTIYFIFLNQRSRWKECDRVLAFNNFHSSCFILEGYTQTVHKDITVGDIAREQRHLKKVKDWVCMLWCIVRI